MKELNNINSLFKAMRLFTIIIIIGSFAFAITTYYFAQQQIKESKEKIYVLTNGDVLQFALSKNVKENRPAEIRSHIEIFSTLFFDLDPDPKEIKNRIDKSLVLIDNSGQQMNSARKEALYYHKIVEGSISSRISIDSIQIDASSYPYRANLFAKQKLVRPSRIVYKKLLASMNVRDVMRTNSNPHGLLIENFRLIDNSTIDEKSRN